jgi:hypothetical protein
MYEIWNAFPTYGIPALYDWGGGSGTIAGSANRLGIIGGAISSFRWMPSVLGTSYLVTTVVVSDTNSGNSYYVNHAGAYSPGTYALAFVKGATAGSVVTTLWDVPQSRWNIDSLDGSGSSRRRLIPPHRVDATQLSMTFVTILDSDSMRCGFVIDGSLVLAHEWSTAKGNMSPTSYEVGCTHVTIGSVGIGSLNLMRCSMFSDTVPLAQPAPLYSMSHCGSDSAKIMTAPVPGATFHILASLRQAARSTQSDRVYQRIRQVSVMNLGAAPVRCRLVRSENVSNLTYNTHVGDSAFRYASGLAIATAATYVPATFANNHVIVDFFVPNGQQVTIVVDVMCPRVGATNCYTIDGVALTGAGTCQCYASIAWDEGR